MAIAGIALLLLAACGGDDAGSPESNADEGGEGQTITLAVVGPMTGDYAIYGTQFEQGVQVAIDQINADGGIKEGPMAGAKLALETFDDQLDPKQTANIAEKIVQDDSIWAVIGSAGSDNSLAAGPIFDRADVAFFSFGSAPQIVENNESVFISSPPHAAYAWAPMAAVDELGYSNPAILKIAGAFGDSIHRLVLEAADARGMTVVSDQEFNFGDKDYKPLLLKAREADPDVIIPIGFASETALIVKQTRSLDWDVPIVDGGGGGYDPSFLEITGDASDGFIGNAPFDPKRGTDAATTLRAAFQEKYGEEQVPPSAATQYEAALVVARAIELGAADRSEVAQYVYDVEIDDTGISSLSFDDEGSPVNRPMYIYHVEGGEFVFDYGYIYDGTDDPIQSIKRIELER